MLTSCVYIYMYTAYIYASFVSIYTYIYICMRTVLLIEDGGMDSDFVLHVACFLKLGDTRVVNVNVNGPIRPQVWLLCDGRC